MDTALFGRLRAGVRHDRPGGHRPYELPIELIVGILGSLIFVVLLLYRLRHGRKAIRLTGGGRLRLRPGGPSGWR